jgi:predicted acetyltransferase
LVKILGLVKEENFASKKILEKIGMKFDEKKFYNEAEILFYSIGNQSI